MRKVDGVKAPPVVALLTDFGTADYYVSAMKGVILKTVPQVQFVDISHDIPPQNIRWGAFQLFSVFRSFPMKTLFLCVVDPGVGSQRKMIFAEADGYRFVGPDNGLLSWVFQVEKPKRVVAIPEPVSGAPVSKTFHGRDILAPFAAALLNGDVPLKGGDKLNSWVTIPFPAVKKDGARWVGEVLGPDRFGNLITSFRSEDILKSGRSARLWFDLGQGQPTIRGLAANYAGAGTARLLAIEGSSGLIEIAARDASAAALTGLKPGDPIRLMFRL